MWRVTAEWFRKWQTIQWCMQPSRYRYGNRNQHKYTKWKSWPTYQWWQYTINTGVASQLNNGDTNVPWENSHTPEPAPPIVPISPPPFTDQAGPQHILPGNASVLEYFLMILRENFFQVLTDQTNLYTTQHPPGTLYRWVDTSAGEMMLFLGTHSVMRVYTLPSVEDYVGEEWTPRICICGPSSTISSQAVQHLHGRSRHVRPVDKLSLDSEAH